MNIFDEINLPQASKQLIFLILKKGGTLIPLDDTNAYLSKLDGKEYIFLGEFTPLTPYMYGIVFSNQKYWFEILKELKFKHTWEPRRTQKKVLFLITKSDFFNALIEKNTTVLGNGKDNVRKLIEDENMRRINHKDSFVMPIKVKSGSINLIKVPVDSEIVDIPNNYDYEDFSRHIDGGLVRKMKKILDFLPGLPFIRLEIFVKDPAHADKLTLGRVLVSPGVNIFFKVVKDKKEADAGKILLSLM